MPRENLLHDAKALVERVELHISGPDAQGRQTVFVGFRADGCASFYFDTDPVYHFNTAGELRRAFVDDRLLKAESGQLVTMRRIRTTGEVHLQSRPLDEAQCQQLATDFRERVAKLRESLATGNYQLGGQVPEDAHVADRVQRWLEDFHGIVVAETPQAR